LEIVRGNVIGKHLEKTEGGIKNGKFKKQKKPQDEDKQTKNSHTDN
jgi:hypothetical protein